LYVLSQPILNDYEILQFQKQIKLITGKGKLFHYDGFGKKI